MQAVLVLAVISASIAGCSLRTSPPAPVATPTPTPTSAPAPTDELVFEYVGSDGEFAYSIELHENGRWSRHEHSGLAVPGGTLPPDAVRRFRALVAAASFRTDAVPCDVAATGSATFRDGSGRSAHEAKAKISGRGWVPCGDHVDDATAGLIGCLELLIDGSDAACASTP